MFDFLKYKPQKSYREFDLTFGENKADKKSVSPDYLPVAKDINANFDSMKKVMHLERNGDIIQRFFNR